MEEVKEKHIYRSKDPHQPSLHKQHQHQVLLHALSTALQGVNTCRETHYTRQEKQRHGNAVQPQLQGDTQPFQSGRQGCQIIVATGIHRLETMPKNQGAQGGKEKTERGQKLRGTLRQSTGGQQNDGNQQVEPGWCLKEVSNNCSWSPAPLKRFQRRWLPGPPHRWQTSRHSHLDFPRARSGK